MSDKVKVILQDDFCVKVGDKELIGGEHDFEDGFAKYLVTDLKKASYVKDEVIKENDTAKQNEAVPTDKSTVDVIKAYLEKGEVTIPKDANKADLVKLIPRATENIKK